MASFRKRPGPKGRTVWQAQVRKRGWPKQARTFDDKTDAEAWARQIEVEMTRGVFVSRTEAEQTTFSDLVDRYLKEAVGQKRSWVQITSALDHVRRGMGEYALAA